MKDNKYEIISNTEIGKDIYEMILAGDTGEISRPGQFINIKVEGLYLRRPISIAAWNDETITIVYKVVGEGTRAMSKLVPGKTIRALCPLGNGFDIEAFCIKENCAKASHTSIDPYTNSRQQEYTLRPLIIGGGLGAAPLYMLAVELIAKGYKPRVIIGAKTASELVYINKFKTLKTYGDAGIDIAVATEDGSLGTKGFVTDVFAKAVNATDTKSATGYVFACGPEPMLKAVYNKCTDGQFDFEARMACGFGACMGCSCETKYGSKRICKDGPILMREEIVW